MSADQKGRIRSPCLVAKFVASIRDEARNCDIFLLLPSLRTFLNESKYVLTIYPGRFTSYLQMNSIAESSMSVYNAPKYNYNYEGNYGDKILHTKRSFRT